MAKQLTPAKLELGSAAKAFLAATWQIQGTLSTSIEVLRDGAWARLKLQLAAPFSPPAVGPSAKFCSVEDSEGFKETIDLSRSPNGSEELWLKLIAKWDRAVVDPSTTTLDTWLDHNAKKELRKLATSAWAELFDTPLTPGQKAKKTTSANRAVQVASVENVLKMLRAGPAGLEQFTKIGLPAWLERNVVNMGGMHWFPQWTPLNLAHAKLANLVMSRVHSSRADFAGADLTNSDLGLGSFPNGNFRGAILRGANLRELRLQGANLQGADFSAARMERASLRTAKCNNTCFVNADMNGVNLCSADLTGANLKGANLQKARYDKNTKWPNGFEPTADTRWMGSGASPVARKEAKRKAPKKRLNVKAFLKRLEKVADPAKLAKALDMLKAQHFKLFAEVTDDRLVGVIKSQAKADLVYSCKISSDGAYGCCTPDLKPCWGMRGTLCKHLLLLIIGLANSGEIDPNVIDHWIQLSQHLKPVLDKQDMADTLVRFKGTEAGEVDWRPTETIPEDFYAM